MKSINKMIVDDVRRALEFFSDGRTIPFYGSIMTWKVVRGSGTTPGSYEISDKKGLVSTSVPVSTLTATSVDAVSNVIGELFAVPKAGRSAPRKLASKLAGEHSKT